MSLLIIGLAPRKEVITMGLFDSKDKARPSRAELIKYVRQHFDNCRCEADGHTIREKMNGYIYTISRTADEGKK